MKIATIRKHLQRVHSSAKYQDFTTMAEDRAFLEASKILGSMPAILRVLEYHAGALAA